MSTPTDGAAVRDLPPIRPLLATPEGVTVHGFKAAGIDEALTWWERLRAIHPETGLWPVIWEVGIVRHLMEATYAHGPAARSPAVAAGPAVPVPRQRVGEHDAVDEHDADEPPAIRHAVLAGRAGRPASLLVAIVPATACWEVFEVLHFGEGNLSPGPSQHARVAHRWHDRWGADLLAMSDDAVEFAVARPPASEAEAAELAAEHLTYSVAFDTDVAGLSRMLVNSPLWIAWWD